MELGRHVLNSDYTLKNFALWSHKCPHVQSLCVCIYTCKHKLTRRVNIMGSLLYRLQQRYLFKIALWHTVVCVCVYVHTHTYIHMCFTKAWIDSGQRKLMWMKNFHLKRPFWMAFCYFTKARFGIFFLLFNFWVFPFFLISFHQYLKIPNTNGRTGIFF